MPPILLTIIQRDSAIIKVLYTIDTSSFDEYIFYVITPRLKLVTTSFDSYIFYYRITTLVVLQIMMNILGNFLRNRIK